MAIVLGSVQLATYTAAEWTAWNGVLLKGQMAFSSDVFYTGTDAMKFKTGDGVQTWTQLDYHPEGGGAGTVTAAANGTGLNGTTVELGVNDLIRDTPLWAAAFKLLFAGTPEAGKQWEFDSGPDLFKLNAHHGLPAINGVGIRYMMTFDGVPVINDPVLGHYPLGKPTSWFFCKVSNDTPVGGDYLATIGHVNLLTSEETYLEASDTLVRLISTNGGNTSGLVLDRALETLTAHINGTDKVLINSSGQTNSDLAGVGTRMVVATAAGLLGTQAIPSGGSGKLVYINSFSTLTSIVGLGYSFATPIYFAVLTIPANTLQAGDIFHVMAGARRSGTGNSAMIFETTNNVSRAASTETYGAHGSITSNTGVNYQTYLYANGDFWDPTGAVATAVLIGDAYANGAGTGGFTQLSAGSGQIDYTQPLYMHCWAIAANTCTLTLLDMCVKVYRP